MQGMVIVYGGYNPLRRSMMLTPVTHGTARMAAKIGYKTGLDGTPSVHPMGQQPVPKSREKKYFAGINS